MTARGQKYLQAAEAIRRLPARDQAQRDSFRSLYELLFELAVMEGAKAAGEVLPREADFRRVWTVEAVKLGIPPEIIKILGS